jgi:hypothetical protein
MPYVTPGDVTTGTTITSTWGNLVGNATDFLANPPACHVYNNANQAVGDAGFLDPILYNTESFDTDTMHSTSSNTGRITINTTGLYQVTANIQFAGANDYLYTQLQIKHSVVGFIAGASTQGNGGAYEPWLNASVLAKCTAGEYLYVTAYQDNTAAASRNIKGTTCWFAAVWVGLG